MKWKSVTDCRRVRPSASPAGHDEPSSCRSGFELSCSMPCQIDLDRLSASLAACCLRLSSSPYRQGAGTGACCDILRCPASVRHAEYVALAEGHRNAAPHLRELCTTRDASCRHQRDRLGTCYQSEVVGTGALRYEHLVCLSVAYCASWSRKRKRRAG